MCTACDTATVPAAEAPIARTFTVYCRGERIDFVSSLTDVVAINILGTLTRNSFAQDLYRNRSRLTDKQIAWAHKIANDNLAPPAPKAEEKLDMSKVFELLDKGKAGGLQYPKLRFQLKCGMVTLSIAGPTAKMPDTLNVSTGKSFSDFCGRAKRDGTWVPGRYNAEVMAFLAELGADPVETCAKYGKLGGCCVFCRIGLTDERSLAMGYGPTCAKNWGLPWGTERFNTQDLIDAPAVEEPVADVSMGSFDED